MLQTTVIALILGFWASLYLADAFFKTHKYMSRCYIDILNATGLNVSILQLRWYTTCFNRLFVRLGQWRGNVLKVWFTFGVVFGLVASMISVMILVLMLINTLKQKPAQEQVLTPVMPGVNLPSSQTGYYLLTLLICGILHEVGHAIAAVRERVRVNGFGLFMFGVYPGAFVDLHTDHLQGISPLARLRIYCAGVWHNFVIVILAVALLLCLPWLLAPFYAVGSGVVVTSVVENSAVSGPRGLHPGDVINSVGGCPVRSLHDWINCISRAMQEKSAGYCVPTDIIKQQDISYFVYPAPTGGYMECCANTSNTHLCFYYHLKGSSDLKYACLPARPTVERGMCQLASDCYQPGSSSACCLPSLDNSTRLLRLTQRARTPLLFLGHPLDLHYAVTLSNYAPRYSVVPVNLPYSVELLCKYLISLSGALAILNVVPCYALDGQWILLSFIELTLRSSVPNPDTRGAIYTIILLFGTALLGANILIAMWSLFAG